MKPYSHIRYLYLRDNKRNPHSCVAVQLDRENNMINYQVSTLSSQDGYYKNLMTFVKTPFVKMTARYITCRRLAKRPFQILTNLKNMSGHEVTRLIMEDIVSREEYYVPDSTLLVKNELSWKDLTFVKGLPQRVRNAAKKWLKLHVEERVTVPVVTAASTFNLVNLYDELSLLGKHQENLPPSFVEDFSSEDGWDSIPPPPVAVDNSTNKLEDICQDIKCAVG